MKPELKKTEFLSQSYTRLWPEVLLSERSEQMIADLSILYAAFPRALNKTIVGILDVSRQSQRGSAPKIQVVEVLAEDDVPVGIRLSYRFADEGLLICDLWTPMQPALFGVS